MSRPANDTDPSQPRHILIHGLSIGSGGGYTVARELFRFMALDRPGWTFTMALISGHSLHEEFKGEDLPATCGLLWAPAETRDRVRRLRWERNDMLRWAQRENADAIVMLNGQTVPGSPVPVLSHNQDPWPYRPEAWTGVRDRIVAFIKRREHKRGLRRADYCGWTSAYLRDLVCGYHKVTPKRGQVFHNGIPDAWIERASGAPALAGRPRQIVTVSNVGPYKRQDLVVRALPEIRRRPGLEDATYHVIGHGEPQFLEGLRNLAAELGVADALVLEGRVPDSRVEQAMRESRCFVLMSVCESFGIPAIEAMSFGTPVVVSDCCAHPEVCSSAARLVPVDDVSALADALAAVLADDAEAERLRALGIERVRAFRWSDTASRMAAALAEITAGRAQQSAPSGRAA